MLMLLLGGAALLLLIGGLQAFSRASVRTVKALLAWVAALAGLSLTLLLVLSGKGPIAFFALTLVFPLLRDLVRSRLSPGGAAQPGAGRRTASPAMSVEEALQVLGLRPGASPDEIRAAHRRLMRAAHPDGGGSDWLASRINQARDILLGQGRAR